MDRVDVQIASVLVALIASAFLTGAGWYEQAVLDPAWPHKPELVRPALGGANRKRFWVPANALGSLSLVAALWTTWPVASARAAILVAFACSIAINAVTIGFFAPAVLRVERDGVAPDAPGSRRWVRLSRLRTPLALGVNAGLAVAIACLDR